MAKRPVADVCPSIGALRIAKEIVRSGAREVQQHIGAYHSWDDFREAKDWLASVVDAEVDTPEHDA